MTASGDFIPNDSAADTGPAYPVVFGIPMSPTLIGILLALLGVLGAVYLLLTLVQPEWDKYQTLSSQVASKKDQVNQQQQIAAQVETAKKELETANQQRQDVLTMFSDQRTIDTLLLDINRQVDARNAGLAKIRQDKLAACPAWVRNNIAALERQVGDLVVRSQMRRFTPDQKASGVINDGSYGPLVNNKLRRETIGVEFEGNFNQTQSVLRSIERLQPLLLLRGVEFIVGDGTPGQAAFNQFYEIQGNTVRFLTNCQPETKITTRFQLEALMPLTPEEQAKLNPPAQPPAK